MEELIFGILWYVIGPSDKERRGGGGGGEDSVIQTLRKGGQSQKKLFRPFEP